MLKTTRLPDKSAPSRNNGNKLASCKKNYNRLSSRRNNGNGEVDGFGVSGNGVEHAKKSIKSKSEKTSKFWKLSKSRKSKGEKTSKSWNSAKSGKKSSKSGNSTNSNATKDKPKFLTPNTRPAFNRLQLAFIKAPILWHFDPECHIWIETDTLGYAIGGVLSQLTFGTNLDEIVTKADLS